MAVLIAVHLNSRAHVVEMGEIKPSRIVYQDESRPDSIESYDVGSVMQQTMAQAGRRRGSRRS